MGTTTAACLDPPRPPSPRPLVLFMRTGAAPSRATSCSPCALITATHPMSASPRKLCAMHSLPRGPAMCVWPNPDLPPRGRSHSCRTSPPSQKPASTPTPLPGRSLDPTRPDLLKGLVTAQDPMSTLQGHQESQQQGPHRHLRTPPHFQHRCTLLFLPPPSRAPVVPSLAQAAHAHAAPVQAVTAFTPAVHRSLEMPSAQRQFTAPPPAPHSTEA